MNAGRDAVLIGIFNLPMAHFDSNKSTKANVRVRIHCEYSVLEVNESAVVYTVLAVHSLDLMADSCVQTGTGRERKVFSLTNTSSSFHAAGHWVPSVQKTVVQASFLKDLSWVTYEGVEDHP